jgi:hypothetical protein
VAFLNVSFEQDFDSLPKSFRVRFGISLQPLQKSIAACRTDS